MKLSKFIGQKIRTLRENKNMTQEDLAKVLNTTRQSVSRYEQGKRKAGQDELFELADFFGISINYFFPTSVQKTDIQNIYDQLNDSRQNKVYHYAENQLEEQNNAINLDNYRDELEEENEKYLHLRRQRSAAGSALGVYDDIQDYDVVPASVVPRGADELVEIVGDSMEPLIKKGQDVYIHHQPVAENGQICIVRIEGDGVTCKRIYLEEDKIRLKSENPDYDDMIVDSDRVTILGIVIF